MPTDELDDFFEVQIKRVKERLRCKDETKLIRHLEDSIIISRGSRGHAVGKERGEDDD